MRLTRAALRAEAPTTPDSETQDASNSPCDPKERVPLANVSPNKVTEPVEYDTVEIKKMPPKKSKAKGGAKKGAKGKKAPKAADEEPQMETVEVLEDERQAVGSPASDVAVDALATGPAEDTVQVPTNDQRPASPPSRAVRMTRRQLAKQEEQLSKSQRLPSPPPQVQSTPEEVIEETEAAQVETAPVVEPEEATIYKDAVARAEEPPAKEPEAIASESFLPEGGDDLEFGEPGPTIEEDQLEAPFEQEVVTPSVEVDEPSPEPKSLVSYTPCDGQSTPISSRTPSRALSKSPSRSPMRLEQSIEAIDALEEALENVGKAIPRLDTSADEKSPRKARFDLTATPNTRAKAAALKKSPLAAPKLSRAPGTIRSLKPPTTKPVPTKASLSRSQSVRVAPSKPVEAKERKGSGQVADYLASKRRPISMSFPTPPPPVKSTRAPTKPTFQLPGEAVAVRLKAAREERLKREAEEKERKEKEKEKEKELVKKPTFKARPAPIQKSAPPPIRQTAASKARENLMNGKPAAEEKEKENKAGSTAPASKRLSSLNPSKRPSSMYIPSTSVPASSTASKRSSMILNPGPIVKSTVTPADAVLQRQKAREIFNRDREEKEAREKERKEKEEAAKRARAEAAERGRIASREWAERQRKKMVAAVAAVAEGMGAGHAA